MTIKIIILLGHIIIYIYNYIITNLIDGEQNLSTNPEDAVRHEYQYEYDINVNISMNTSFLPCFSVSAIVSAKLKLQGHRQTLTRK